MNPINSEVSLIPLNKSEKLEENQEQGKLNEHLVEDYTASIEEHPTGAKALAKKVGQALWGEKWTLATGGGVGGGSFAATSTVLGLSLGSVIATFPVSLGIATGAIAVMSAVSIPLMSVVVFDYLLRDSDDHAEKSPLPEFDPEKEIPKKKIDVQPDNEDSFEMDIGSPNLDLEDFEMDIGSTTLKQKGEEAEKKSKKDSSSSQTRVVNGEVIIEEQ